MDQSTLVSSGHLLLKELDAKNLKPRLAMWVHNTDTDTWRLWIVPPPKMKDKHEFYRTISEIVAKHRTELGSISASDTEMVPDTHPAVKGLKNFLKAPGLANIYFSGNVFNGFYLPDGVILRSDL